MSITNSKKAAKAAQELAQAEAQQILDSVERLHICAGGFAPCLTMVARIAHQVNVNEWLRDNTDPEDLETIGVLIEFFTDLIKIRDSYRGDIHQDDSEMNALRNLDSLLKAGLA